MNTITGTGMAAAGAAAPAGSTCEGLWSIFATDVGSFEETARGSGSGGIFLVTAQARRAGGATREH